jgi:hypothetical protein
VPAAEVRRKIADYAAREVECVYIVHAEAFRAYDKAVGITSLHDREISVPEWVREVATPDPRTARRYAPVGDGPFVPYRRMFVHVWANGRLWVLELRAVYREREWNDESWIQVLATQWKARLLGALDPPTGSWRLAAEPGLASYEAVWSLAAQEELHSSVATALAAAPPPPGPRPEAPFQRSALRGAPRCAPSPSARSAPVRPAPLWSGLGHQAQTSTRKPTGSDDPQLGLGLALPPVAPSRPRINYD